MSRAYPRRGELVALDFDPQAGHEQAGRRPALVISKDLFNRHTGLCIVCPVTRTSRDFPFHVALPADGRVTGWVMVEQAKSVDYRSRNARRIGRVPEAVLDEALSILYASLFAD